MLVSVALVLIALTVILFDHLKLMRRNRWLHQFPGPSPTFPIIGNGLEFIGHPSEMGAMFRKNFQRYGSVWRLWLMKEPTLVTSDPEILKTLLNSQNHLDKHFIYTHSTKILLGEYGLITSSGKQWKGDRKVLNQLFTIAQMEKTFKQTKSDCPRLRADLEATVGKPFECQTLFRNFFLKNIMLSFNVDPKVATDEMVCESGELMHLGLDLVKIRFMKPWTRNPIYWKIFGYQRQLDHFHERIGFFFNQSLQYFEEMLKNADSEMEDSKAARTVIGHLGESSVNPQWKYDQAVTMAGAGTDTTAITATMTLFFLALNPECQRKAQNEVDSLFEGRADGELLFTDLPKLKYLRMCIKEAMRLHAPAAVIGRNTTEEILMEDGRKIPKDTGVLLVIPEMHMNPDNFPNPEKFDPERFNESNVTAIKPYTYMPFSVGPRNCVGQKYAESVLASVLAIILRDFTVKTNQKAADIKSLYEIAGQPYPNVALTFDKRC